ncbi:heme biosynthesis HemY N-terminal domain-containing protein [Neisseria shayeganii]|uniref:Heme biosynthesis protein HemY n=1 Tax=Neisseria shayeganii TaxID=607712 RepID=A0A7D7N5A7_9NEIS|nr:heme biosynthesis HemY N-terminal domain-containing protein [Neisseria shayeganii]QMT39923.1 heme biosynthesis protein HemY [Neisseria shayeganii]
MKGLIWIIVLFAAAVGLVLAAQTYSGNVYLVIDQTQTMVAMSLHLFVGALIVSVAVLYLLLRLIDGVTAVPGRLRRFGSKRSARHAAESLNKAGLAFFEGKFQQAEREAAKVLDNKQAGDNRVLALMLAAHSADQAGDEEKREGYLKDIAGLPDKNQLSRHLLLAESALNRRDYPAAEAALNAAAAVNPKLTRLVRLQLRYMFEQNNPLEVLDRVAKLEKAAALNSAEAAQYREWAYRELLALAQDYPAMKACLARIPEDLKRGDLCADIAAKFVQTGQYPRAVKWVKHHYPETHNSQLLPHMIEAARYLSEKEQQKVMDTAESWLTQTPDNAHLLFNLGQMAYAKKLWGKAQSYLEASLNAQATPQARLVLAKVFDEMGQPQQAEAQRKLVLAEITPDEDETATAAPERVAI